MVTDNYPLARGFTLPGSSRPPVLQDCNFSVATSEDSEEGPTARVALMTGVVGVSFGAGSGTGSVSLFRNVSGLGVGIGVDGSEDYCLGLLGYGSSGLCGVDDVGVNAFGVGNGGLGS